jgi:hypothetical protein
MSKLGEFEMSDASAKQVWFSRVMRLAAALDRAGLCLIYAFVFAVLPITAAGLFVRTV